MIIDFLKSSLSSLPKLSKDHLLFAGFCVFCASLLSTEDKGTPTDQTFTNNDSQEESLSADSDPATDF